MSSKSRSMVSIVFIHNVKIHQYEYGRCFRMKIREDCVNLSDVMFGLTVYVHS